MPMLRWLRGWAESPVGDRADSSTSTVPTEGSTRKAFPSGIKLLHEGENPVAE